jgi:hypothetical protein
MCLAASDARRSRSTRSLRHRSSGPHGRHFLFGMARPWNAARWSRDRSPKMDTPPITRPVPSSIIRPEWELFMTWPFLPARRHVPSHLDCRTRTGDLLPMGQRPSTSWQGTPDYGGERRAARPRRGCQHLHWGSSEVSTGTRASSSRPGAANGIYGPRWSSGAQPVTAAY